MKHETPRWIRCYDDGGESCDRYTVCYTGRRGKGQYATMSADPFHPQGFGQHGQTNDMRACDVNQWGYAPVMGRKNHLGTRIPFDALPADCQRLVLNDYAEIWQ